MVRLRKTRKNTMKKHLAPTLSILLALPFSANAAITGNELHAFCSGQDTGLCMGIITGTVSGFKFAELAHKKETTPLICVPDNVTNNQIIDIVKNYLRDKPGERHNSATSAILYAVRDAFPCR